MNNGIKFHLRFTGPMHRMEYTNKRGVFVSADKMEEIAENFFAALKREIEFSRIAERDGIEAAIAVRRAEIEARRLAEG